MKLVKSLACIMLLTVSSIFSAESDEDLLTTDATAGSPSTNSTFSDTTNLVSSTTAKLKNMLPYLDAGSRNKIEEIIRVLQGDGDQKFTEAEALLRACEIIPDEEVTREGSPIGIELASSQRSLRLLNQDILHVIRSLGLYLNGLPTEDDYDADIEVGSVGCDSPGDF